MKLHWLTLSLLSFLSLQAQAQSTQTPSAGATPEVSALLESAVNTYKDAKGLSFRTEISTEGHKTQTVDVQFARPGKLSFVRKSDGKSQRYLRLGPDLYVIEGNSYRKQEVRDLSGPSVLKGMTPGTGSFFAALLEGKNPVTDRQSLYQKAPFKDFQSTTVAVPARTFGDQILSGVQNTLSYSYDAMGKGKASRFRNQTTAWFTGYPLMLQRIESSYTVNGTTSTFVEEITNQQLNPTFAPDTFKFNAAGLKKQEEEAYFDPRIKVGTVPFAFSATDLKGQTISPAKYKGKVLVLDFWATWCGPCVAALPELKATYDKYHARGLEVVSISLDEDKKALTSFIAERKMMWPQVYDGKGWKSRVASIYGVHAIPFMVVIGKNGKIVALEPEGKLEATVKAALAAK